MTWARQLQLKVSDRCDARNSTLDLLDLPLLPIIVLACCILQTRAELFHHGDVVTCIIASNMANLLMLVVSTVVTTTHST